MNFLFWSLTLLMMLVAIAIIVFPLLRAARSKKHTLAYKDSNVVLHEEKLAELDIDLAELRIDQDQYRIARQELDRELLDNVPAESVETASEHYTVRWQRHPALALTVAVFVPAIALLMYSHLGMQATGGADGQAAAQEMAQPEKTPSVEVMTANLEKFLQTHKGSVQEWTMLGRAYKYLKRYKDSIKAFDQALKLQPDNAQLMLETAEAIALLNGQVFNKAAVDLIMRAKALEPDNANVLWFAGVADFQLGHYRASIDSLSRLAAVAKADKDVDQSIRSYLEQARNKLIAKGEVVASVDKLLEVNAKSVQVPSSEQAHAQEQDQASTTQTTAAATGVSLHVAVSVSADVRAKFSPGDTVFIYAKAAQGPPMPLAVQRLTLGALPTQVTLDDSMAMMAGMNLSAFPDVVVSARISRSGSAIAQSGDYIGEHQIKNVKSAKDIISININKVVP
jgi:cytochrome c-type biogenesis protein CcmH